MKLAYLVNQYPSPSQTFIREEIGALERLGVSVERYTIRGSSTLADAADREEQLRTRVVLDEGPVRIGTAVVAAAARRPRRVLAALWLAIVLGRRSARGVALHLVYFAEACVLAAWLEEARITHLHVHFGTNAATVALLAEALGGPPFSFTVHGPEEFDRPEGLKLRHKVARAAFVVAISDYCRSQIYRWSDVEDWEKVHIVHCGLGDRFLRAVPTPAPAAPRLVSVGRLSEQKGQLLLVEAMSRLSERRPDARLVLVGDGPMRPEIEERIERLGCSDSVQLAGLLDNDSVRAEILAARATVLPSFAEGLPVVLMESLALGRPVVSTFVAAIPELVDAGCGWLVPAGALDALVEALEVALEVDPSVLETMGAEGRRRVRERHDADTEASVLLGLFSSHAGGDTPRQRAAR